MFGFRQKLHRKVREIALGLTRRWWEEWRVDGSGPFPQINAADDGTTSDASEVEQLASQSAQATQEISGQINEIRVEAGRAIEAIRNITKVADLAQDLAANIADAINQQVNGTEENA